jgi:hypothetical protein
VDLCCWLLWIPFLWFLLSSCSYHEHFSVFFRKGKDWYALFIVIFSLIMLCKTFVFTEHTVYLWNRAVLHGDSCADADLYPWRKRDFHQHPYLRDARSSSFIASKHNFFLLHWRLGEFLDHFMIASVRCAVTHHGIMPRYPTIDLFS